MRIRKIANVGAIVAKVINNFLSTSATDALSAGKGKELYERTIIETVTNSNGTAIKYSDGTMIVTQKVGVSQAVTTSWHGLYVSAKSFPDFPVAFTTLYSCSLTLEGALYNAWVMTSAANTLTKAGSIYLISAESIATFNGYVNVIAVGKWK